MGGVMLCAKQAAIRRLAGGHRDGIITSAPAAEHKMGDMTATARCCALPPLLLLMSSLLDTSRC